MAEITLQNVSERLERMERAFDELRHAINPPVKDWSNLVGMSEDNEFTRAMLAEIAAAKAAERAAALCGDSE